MDENTYPQPAPVSGMSAADCQELAQRRLEEKNAMKAKIAALEDADREKDARIAALEAKLSGKGSKPGSDDDDSNSDDDSGKKGAGAVKPKAASTPPPAPARPKRFCDCHKAIGTACYYIVTRNLERHKSWPGNSSGPGKT